MKDGPRPKHPKPGEKPPKVPVATPHWTATELGTVLLTRLRARPVRYFQAIASITCR